MIAAKSRILYLDSFNDSRRVTDYNAIYSEKLDPDNEYEEPQFDSDEHEIVNNLTDN